MSIKDKFEEYIKKYFNKKNILISTTIIMVLIFIFIICKSYKIAKARNDINNLPLIKSDVDIVKVKHEIRVLPAETNSFYETFKKEDDNKKETINIIETEKDNDEILPVVNKTVTIDTNEDINDKNLNEDDEKIKDEDNEISNNIDIKKEERVIELNNYEDTKITKNERVNGEITDKKLEMEKQNSNIKEVIINKKKEESKNKDNIVSINLNNGNIYRAQLVALKNKQQALIFIEKTKKKYSDILKGLDLYITEINLNEKGIFYRVQVGNFDNKIDANNFCENYKKYSNSRDLINCIVVK